MRRIETNEIDDKKKASLRNRLVVSGILIAIAVPALVFGSWFWFALISLFLVMAIYEVIKAPNKKYSPLIYIFTYVIILSFVYWFLVKYNVQRFRDLKLVGNEDAWVFSLENWYSALYISVYGIALAFGFYCLFAIIHKDFSWNDVIYLFTMSIVIGVGFQSFLFLRYFPFAAQAELAEMAGTTFAPDNQFKWWGSNVLVIFVIACCYLNDSWAYFVGMLFGKHHMNERVSPNKTWEGFFGGWILGGISAFAFAMICDACGFPLLESMRIFGEKSAWWWPLILSFSLPLIGDIGDFTFSLIKRHYGIKDYGKSLGAMGGVLDRADSLLFCSIYASVFVVFIDAGWNFFA
ncbi:MAG: phosphatidate cytidylyltransferase [Bacilli bacterium]|nr:phosphatidate cytidylyltransferase [Bacilli bacterium]